MEALIMYTRATDGTLLDDLIDMAGRLCRSAQEHCPRRGPGRRPDFSDGQIAALIMIAVLKKRKSKSSQYRFLTGHRARLTTRLGLPRWPARSTYCDRYRRIQPLLTVALQRQGRQALRQGISSAVLVAADKSLLSACGPPWHRAQQQQGRRPRGVDPQARWSYSPYHGWVWGYSYEVVVTATPGRPVVPLLASVAAANASEQHTLTPKIDQLPKAVRHVLADSGYDSNLLGERIEYDPQGRRTGRRFLCPLQPRAHHARPGATVQRGRREQQRRRRQRRFAFYRSRRGRRLYARRGQSVEPFNEWFKHLYDLEPHVWHRGLDNNQTQLLAALCGYQLLLRYNHRHRRRPLGQIQCLLDAL